MDVDNLHQMWKGRPLENSITEEGTNQHKVQDRQTDGGRLNEKQAIKNVSAGVKTNFGQLVAQPDYLSIVL